MYSHGYVPTMCWLMLGGTTKPIVSICCYFIRDYGDIIHINDKK